MENYFAVVNPQNIAINFVIWDGKSDFDYGQDEGNYLVHLEGQESYGVGWIWNGTSFVEPADVP